MSSIQKKKGKLFLVATPIGNLQDITLRALDILNYVDVIACEDTRHTLQLLTHFNIKKPLTSYHEHNKFDKAKDLTNELICGNNIALVTDAGTPIISDPGAVLVKEAIANNIEVTSVPGACACINAIILSGFDATKFTFIGFLSDKKNEKIEKLSQYIERTETLILYSSKSQIIKDLSCIKEIFGEEKKITISREMTKIYEQIIRGTVDEIINSIDDKNIMGEFVICIEGISEESVKKKQNEIWQNMSIVEHIEYYMKNGFAEKEAIKKVAKDRNLDKNDVYKCIKVKENNDEC